jgi:hypothetical protein
MASLVIPGIAENYSVMTVGGPYMYSSISVRGLARGWAAFGCRMRERPTCITVMSSASSRRWTSRCSVEGDRLSSRARLASVQVSCGRRNRRASRRAWVSVRKIGAIAQSLFAYCGYIFAFCVDPPSPQGNSARGQDLPPPATGSGRIGAAADLLGRRRRPPHHGRCERVADLRRRQDSHMTSQANAAAIRHDLTRDNDLPSAARRQGTPARRPRADTTRPEPGSGHSPVAARDGVARALQQPATPGAGNRRTHRPRH